MPSFTICRVRTAGFTRCGYRVRLSNDDGTPFYRRVRVNNGVRDIGHTYISDPMSFYGNDGRTVRAEAIRWARQQIAPR